jgi:hypothetical protein
MKIQCERCREIVPIGDFVSSEAGIRITCESCEETFFVPAGASPEPDPEPDPEPEPDREPGSDCPKCGRPVAEALSACPECGLRRDRFSDFGDDRDEGSPALVALWEACEADWAAEARHDRFVDAAAAAGAYAFAARRYRAALRERREDEVAATRLSKVARMAEAALLAAAVTRDPETDAGTPYRGVVIVLLFLVLLAGIGGVYLLIKAGAGAWP